MSLRLVFRKMLSLLAALLFNSLIDEYSELFCAGSKNGTHIEKNNDRIRRNRRVDMSGFLWAKPGQENRVMVMNGNYVR